MAIEIRELYIKAVVDAGAEKKGNGAGESSVKETPEQNEANAEGMIDVCVQKILEILKEKMER